MLRIKKYLLIIILLISIVFYTSCAANGGSQAGGAGSGIPNDRSPIEYKVSDFTKVTDFTYNYEDYTISILTNYSLEENHQTSNKPNIIYYVEEYKIDKSTNVSNWAINYKQDVASVICESPLDEAFVNVVYDKIKMSLLEAALKLELSLEYYHNLYNVEKELPVNMNIEFESVYAVDLYLPFLLQNQTTKLDYILNIPIKSILAYLNKGNFKVVLDEFEVVIPIENLEFSPYIFEKK